jgi:hypothetical protein
MFYDRTRKRWPFNTGDCLIEVTAWPVIEHFICIEPLLRGHLSYKATFSLSQRSPLNTALTVLFKVALNSHTKTYSKYIPFFKQIIVSILAIMLRPFVLVILLWKTLIGPVHLYFNCIVKVTFIGRENRMSRRQPLTDLLQLADKFYSIKFPSPVHLAIIQIYILYACWK